MRILYLSPAGGLGGAEKVLWSVMAGVRRVRPDAVLRLLAFSDGPLVQRAVAAGIETTVEPLPQALASLGDSQLHNTNGRLRAALAMVGQTVASAASAWLFLSRLQRILHVFQPDLLHSNGIKTHCFAWLASPRRLPIVWHVHDFFSARPLARRLLMMASRRLSAAIAISRAVADDLRAIDVSAPTTIVPNGVDVDLFSPAPQDGALLDRLAKLDPCDRDCLRVGLIATYARWKGQDVFLQAAAQVKAAGPVRFYIIGGPIYQTRGSQFERRQLQEMALRLGIASRVGFIDFQRDVAPIYRALDIVVHASTAAEPFGLTIIEAMASGKPVVATYAGGVVDIIRPGHDGLAVAPGNAEALANAIQVLLADSGLRSLLGTNARNTVCERFDERRVGRQIVDLYEPLLERRRPGLHRSLLQNSFDLHASFNSGE